MGTESTILAQTTEIIRLLREVKGATTAPKVDFIVDMFDREDQDSLGSYWSNREYGLRGNVVVYEGGDGKYATVATAVATWNGTSNIGKVDVHGVANTLAQNIYLADLTSQNFTCEVGLVFSPSIYPRTSSAGGTSSTRFLTVSVDGQSHTGAPGAGPAPSYAPGLAAHGGACVANDQNKADGFGFSRFNVPSLYAYATDVQAGVTYVASADIPAWDGVKLMRGNDITVAAAPLSESSNVISMMEYGSSYWLQAAAGSSEPHSKGVVSGNAHTARIVCQGDIVTMTLDGVTVFSGRSPYVSPLSRTRAGFMTPAANMIASLLELGAPTAFGITSFKAWRNDVPKPPDQSGHGTYEVGKFLYADKYHTAIKDDGGNIIGYNYDPSFVG